MSGRSRRDPVGSYQQPSWSAAIDTRSKKRRRSAAPYTRRLRFEPLEHRRLLSIIVNTKRDEADGSISDGDISLRDAIALAPSGETIGFSVTGTIGFSLGELIINKNLTIVGPGAHLLTIEQDTFGSSRVLNIDDGNSTNDKTVSISGLTLTGGNVSGADNQGGAIRSRENLTLTACTISGNETTDSLGGGIWQHGGNLAISASTISGNTARFGGGLSLSNVNATIEGSTISGNYATSGGGHSGGGIALGFSSLTLTGSTISGNSASYSGGGIYLSNSSLIAKHSTITGNRSSTFGGFRFGGGIFATYSGATLDHTIVAGNFRSSGRDDVSVEFSAGPLLASYSLIGDMSGTALVEAPVGSPDANGNLIGGPINGAIDPLLGSLADYGGRTWTHALLAGSPAIDAGDPDIALPPTNDQRGAPFARITDGDAAGGARIDIGAYERQTLPAAIFEVTTATDEFNYANGDVSLREAINVANGSIGPDTIYFAAALSGQTILLGGRALVLSEAVTIDATPLADNLEINAQQNSRIFFITSDTGDFTLGGLTLSGGRTTDGHSSGGAILSLTTSNLTLIQSTIRGNSTIGDRANGGGIHALAGVTLNQSTVSGNSTTGFESRGGGISTYGAVTLTQSTVSGNGTAGYSSLGSAVGSGGGGGIWALGGVTLTQSTVSGNSTAGRFATGGGIWVYGALTLTQSTVSGNSTAGNFADGGGIWAHRAVTLAQSTLTDNRTNFSDGLGGGVFQANTNYDDPFSINGSIVAGNAGSGFADLKKDSNSTLTVDYSLIGLAVDPDDGGNNVVTNSPELGPLAYNGGPTATRALLPGSPAIDAGDANFNPDDPDGNPMTVDAMPYDQRRAPFNRVYDGNSADGARIDIGAFEFQPLPPAFFGDYNENGTVDAADYVVWRKSRGTTGVPAYSGADGNGDTVIDLGDHGVWRANFGRSLPPAAGTVAEQTRIESQESSAAPAAARGTAATASGQVDGAGESGRLRSSSGHHSPLRRLEPIAPLNTARHDDAILAWLASVNREVERADSVASWSAAPRTRQPASDSHDALDAVFRSLVPTM